MTNLSSCLGDQTTRLWGDYGVGFGTRPKYSRVYTRCALGKMFGYDHSCRLSSVILADTNVLLIPKQLHRRVSIEIFVTREDRENHFLSQQRRDREGRYYRKYSRQCQFSEISTLCSVFLGIFSITLSNDRLRALT